MAGTKESLTHTMRLYVGLASALGAVSCVAAQSVSRPCSPGSKAAGLPFCDTKLGMEERITDLLGRLTLVDKVSEYNAFTTLRMLVQR